MLQYSQPSLVLGDTQVRRVHKLCEVFKAWLLNHRETWLRRRSGRPILESYASDCTPLKTVEIYKQGMADIAVSRSGRSSREWLVQRLFLTDAEGATTCAFVEPKLLSDKTAWTHCQAQLEMTDMARQLHKGITIAHHCWDRAVVEPCTRHQLQRHAAYDELLHDEMSPFDATMACMQSWFTSCGCMAHDLHNSLRWSVMSFLGDAAVMRSCWIVMESLRNSFDLLVLAMPVWLSSVLAFEDFSGTPGILDAFWRMLGLEESWVSLLVFLQLRWEHGRLKVAHRFEGDECAPELIFTCLLRLWRFRSWTSSRWCSVGESCRCIIGCSFVGLRALVTHILTDGKSSKYYLAGFEHLSDSVVEMCGVVSVAGRVAERCLASILKDDRVCRNLDYLCELLRYETSHALGLPDEVFGLVGGLCGSTAVCLRDKVATAVGVQRGYIESKMREARKLPWCLARGNITENLTNLLNSPPPAEPTSAKVHKLLSSGFSPESLVEAVGLLAETNWTTTVVEQGHSVTSSLAKKHPAYSQKTLTSRAMVTQAATLFRGDPLDRKVQKSRLRLRRLRAKRPERISARHAFCGELFATARRVRAFRDALPSDFSKRVIKNHAVKWQRLSGLDRAAYEARAVGLRAQRRRSVDDNIAKERVLLMSRRAEQEAASGHGRPSLRLGRCRLSDAQLTDFNAMFENPMWSQKHIDNLRREACLEVGQPPSQVKATLDLMTIDVPKKASAPQWARWVARHRDVLCGSILKFDVSGSPTFFKVVFAVKSPVFVCLSPVEPVEVEEPFFTASSFESVQPHLWEHTFRWNMNDFLFSDCCQLPDDGKVEVLTDVVFRPPRLLCADGPFLSYVVMLQWLDDAPAPAAPSSDSQTTDKVDWAPWMADPMMWQFVRDLPSDDQTRAPERRKSSKSQPSQPKVALASEAEQEAAMEALWDHRLQVALDGAEEGPEHFTFTVRGGRWTLAHLGVAYDSFRAHAARAEAKDWCALYSLQKSATYSIALYGEEICMGLCKAWIHRMAFFYEMWVARGSSRSFCYSQDDLELYGGLPEDFALGAITGPALARLSAIGRIRPKAPRSAR